MNLKDKIHTIREKQVILDKDLAELYGVKTKRLNEQVKRNIDRFPESFCFQLSEDEKDELVATCDHHSKFKHSNSTLSLRSQFVTLENKRGKHSKYLPYAFTEQGVSMLSAVLK